MKSETGRGSVMEEDSNQRCRLLSVLFFWAWLQHRIAILHFVYSMSMGILLFQLMCFLRLTVLAVRDFLLDVVIDRVMK